MADFKNWASIIRSCTLTSKTPLTIYEVNRDTKMLEGKDIPYKQLGYSTLEQMLRSIPGLHIFSQAGKTVVQGIPSDKTAHISQMVRAQKSAKKKPRTLPSAFNKFRMNNKQQPFHQANNPSKNVPQNKFSLKNKISQQQNCRPQPAKSMPPTAKSHFSSDKKVHTNGQAKTPSPPPMPANKLSKKVRFAVPKEQKIATTGPSSSVQQRLAVASAPAPIVTPNSVPAPASGTSSISQRLNIAQVAQNLQHTLDDPRLRLNQFTEERNLPLPLYKDVPVKSRFIYSSVTVDSKKYSSYPQEAKTKDEAEKLAAQVALKELIGSSKKPNVVTQDKNLVIKRVASIVNEHPNGLFESSFVESYITKYGENLPTDWLKLVENSVVVDVGANNLTILSPQNKDNVRKTNGRPSSPIEISEPEILRINTMSEFWIHIYVAYDTTDIWGVIIDENHSDEVEKLAKEMNTYYKNNELTRPVVTPGKYYTLFDEEWHRVRCIKVNPEAQTTTVFFIDRGDEDVFPINSLQVLPSEFCRLPAQSVRLSMEGLEAFQECENIQGIMEETLVNKDVYVQIMNVDEKLREERYTGTISAQLYCEIDNEGVNMNDLLQAEIFKVLDPTVYMRPEKVAQEVYISHVTEKDIFVQMKSQGLQLLKTRLSEKTKDFKTQALLRFDPTKVYIALNTQDNNCYRVKIVRIINENTAEVLCIDEGNKLIVKQKDLILLDDSDFLVKYPKQAVKVQLHKISPIMFDKKMAEHLSRLAPKTDVFYMKVVDDMKDILMVEFYKRTENNFLASLNDTLALEPEITSKDDNNNAKPRIRNDRSSLGANSEFPLKAPSIPGIGCYFDVYVTMAAHPGNFTIQPLNANKELDQLMVSLTNICDSYTGPPLTMENVKVGSMYAAKYDDDNRWYRAYVSKLFNKNACVVYYCDYGDYKAVSLDKLQPLPSHFYNLPYQAIKAKLHGIVPKLKGDWTVKDSLRFNELIVAKRFVSIVKSCDIDNHSTGECILGLELIDTSTPDDIYITDILVNEKRAEKSDESRASG